MRLKLQPASVEDAGAIAALRNAVSDDLARQHGHGFWFGRCTARGIRSAMRKGNLYVVRRGGRIIASLNLLTRKPWAIKRKYFTPVARPLYLVSMVVAPELQGQGIGRACLDEAVAIARRFPADAIFLDAYDHPAAGAGPFYAKCGFRETGRARYRGAPLIYFEYLL